jgi:hypothetical protein
MAEISYKPKKIVLDANMVADINYIRSILEPIVKKKLSDKEIIAFCLVHFIKIDEALTKIRDELREEYESSKD